MYPRQVSNSHERSADKCPLCANVDLFDPIRGADDRVYHRCQNCDLIYADRRHLLSAEEAAAHYRTHENDISNAGYVRFLRRVIDPMLVSLNGGMRGLDYGCGPGPTLSVILRQHGIACEDYDPIFADRPLNPPYDFVFSTECFEHFVDPAAEIARIAALIEPGGYLGVMTECWTELDRFATWYYTRDLTHVSFFHDRTFDCVCQQFGFRRLPSADRRVFLFQRDNG